MASQALANRAKRAERSAGTGRAAFRPLRIDPVSVLARRELRSSSPPALQISLEVAWEPRLQPIAVKQRMADLKVLDSSGGSLAAEDPRAEKEAFPRLGQLAVKLNVSFAMPRTDQRNRFTDRLFTCDALASPRSSASRSRQRQAGKRIAAATVSCSTSPKTRRLPGRPSCGSALTPRAMPWNRTASVPANRGLPGRLARSSDPADTMETTLRTKNEISARYVFALPDFPRDMTFV